MDRKKTILITIFINAGLLAVLFVIALSTQEEAALQSEMVQQTLPKLDPNAPLKPLFEEPIELPVMAHGSKNGEAQQQMPLVQLPTPEQAMAPSAPAPSSKTEEPIVHKLPPLVPETAPAARPPETSHLEVVVKKGDSLDKIAKSHHTTIDEIIKLNRLPSSFLKIGQMLKIPAAKTYAAAPKLKPAAPAEKTAGPEYYTVKVGDNPWTIAMKHHMKVEELLRLNSLNEEKARKLKVGDRLRVR